MSTDPAAGRPSTARAAPPWYKGPPLLVPGTVVACYLVATGRWGSHLGWPEHSLYVTDIGLAVTGLWTLLRHRHAIHLGRRLLTALAVPVVAIAAWTAVRMLTNGTFDSVALRDAAPFGYVLVALVGLVTVDRAARRRTLAVLWVALILHAAWVTAALHLSLPTYYLSGGLLRIFEVRPDFDSAMLGVLCGLASYEAFRPLSSVAAGGGARAGSVARLHPARDGQPRRGPGAPGRADDHSRGARPRRHADQATAGRGGRGGGCRPGRRGAADQPVRPADRRSALLRQRCVGHDRGTRAGLGARLRVRLRVADTRGVRSRTGAGLPHRLRGQAVLRTGAPDRHPSPPQRPAHLLRPTGAGRVGPVPRASRVVGASRLAPRHRPPAGRPRPRPPASH